MCVCLSVCVCLSGWVCGRDGGGYKCIEEAYLGVVYNCHQTSNCQSVRTVSALRSSVPCILKRVKRLSCINSVGDMEIEPTQAS